MGTEDYQKKVKTYRQSQMNNKRRWSFYH